MGWGEISSILNLPSFSLLTSHSNLNTKNLKILPSHTQQCLNPKVKVLFPHQACAGREKFLQAGVRAWPPSNTLCFLTHCLSPAASWLWHIAQPSSWSLNKATCQHCTLTALYKKKYLKGKSHILGRKHESKNTSTTAVYFREQILLSSITRASKSAPAASLQQWNYRY